MIDAGCYDHASSTEYGSERGGCGTAATSSSAQAGKAEQHARGAQLARDSQ